MIKARGREIFSERERECVRGEGRGRECLNVYGREERRGEIGRTIKTNRSPILECRIFVTP